MDPSVEQRLIQLLRESPAPAVPLRDLHEALAAESPDRTVSYGQLAEALRRRREVFILLESRSPLGDETAWPAGVRAEYERALVDAGVDTGPHISLADPVDGEIGADRLESPPTGTDVAPWIELRQSLLRVWHSALDNPSMRTAVAAAIAGCADLPEALREPVEGRAGLSGS